MATHTVKLGCIPALFLFLLIAACLGGFVGLLIGVANMVSGWFS